MATKLNTRILLRYDSYENWVKDTATVLLAGEVAICTVPAGYTQSDSGVKVQNPPKTLMKVGPGAFKDLPWLSAVAADVHEWAKKSENDFRAWLTSTDGPALATQTEVNKVASDLTALTTRVTTAEGDIDALEGRMTTAEGDIDGLETRMTTAEGDITGLKAAVGTGADGLATKVAGLTTRMDTAESNISANAGAITDITEDGGIIDTKVAAEKSRAEGVESGLAARIKTVEDDYLKAADKTELTNAINTEKQRAESAESGLGTRIDGVSTVANAADTLSKSNKAAIDTLNGAANVEGSVRYIAADEINTLIGGVSSADTINDIKSLIEYVNENGADFTELNGTVEEHTETLSTVAGQITALQGKDTDHEAAIKAINDKIGNDVLDEGETIISRIAANDGKAQGYAATAEDNAKDYTDAEIAKVNTAAGKLSSTVEGHTALLAGIEGATVKADINAAQAAAIQEVTDLANGQVKTNKEAIDAINNGETGILAQAKKYTDDEIKEVESALAGEKADREAFDKTALTGVISGENITVSLDGKALDLIFVCGGAQV